MEQSRSLEEHLQVIHPLLERLDRELEEVWEQVGLRKIVQSIQSAGDTLPLESKLMITPISTNVVAAYLAEERYEEFVRTVSSHDWFKDEQNANRMLSWLAQERQEPWITLLLLAFRGRITAKIVALVGAQMYAES